MKRALHGVIAGILLAACSAGAVAQAIDEVEDETIGQNYPNAQPLKRGTDGRMVVNGAIGATEPWGTVINDVDLYSFYAPAGAALTFDIDQGIKTSTLVTRSVDTTLSLLGPGPTNKFELKRQQKTCLAGKFGISVDSRDACILNFSADMEGIYIVAVTADPVVVIDGGHIVGDMPSSNGSYTLIVTGASEIPAAPQVQLMNIDIRPKSRAFVRLDLKSKGNIPVALLSDEKFEPLKVDRDSLTFGAKGDENSLRNCAWEGEYVNADDKLDLVCHFDKQAAKFGPENAEGVLNGTIGGKRFEGRSVLKVLPELQQENGKKQK